MPELVQIENVGDAGPISIALGDLRLVSMIDSALADSARRSGEWLVCRPGCMQCCVGAFAISQLDARRLREGMTALAESDPERAARVQWRAKDYIERLGTGYPGDPVGGMLDETREAELQFEAFANDEVCPALDPDTGTCDLYAARPMTCRAFGPPIRSEEGLGVCELCFHGATDEEIAACEMEVDPDGLEEELLQRIKTESGVTGQTIVAFCLVD
ncbi:MAG TPA: YkgJ family cysteine cluster protein [Acidisarcina sp.]